MSITLFQILAVLRGGPRNSNGILERLTEVGGAQELPSLPAFYRHLARAVDEGSVEIVGTQPPEDGRGRPRQIYTLTASGVQAVQERARWLTGFTRLAGHGPAELGDA